MPEVAFGVTGAAGKAFIGSSSMIDEPTGLLWISDSVNDVTINKVARTTVILAKNEEAPLAPKRVWLEPPIITPVSAPFPDWRRTAAIIRMQVTT